MNVSNVPTKGMPTLSPLMETCSGRLKEVNGREMVVESSGSCPARISK